MKSLILFVWLAILASSQFVQKTSPEANSEDELNLTCMTVIQQSPQLLPYCSEVSRNNPLVVSRAIMASGGSILLAGDKFKHHKLLAMAAISRAREPDIGPRIFEWLSDELKRDIDVVLMFVQFNPVALKLLPVDVLANETIFRAFINQTSFENYISIPRHDPRYRENPLSYDFLDHFSSDLTSNQTLMLELVSQKPLLLCHTSGLSSTLR